MFEKQAFCLSRIHVNIDIGVNIPASDPFRLTPLLLAKLKLDNLRHAQRSIHNTEEDQIQWMSESAKSQYDDVKQVSRLSWRDARTGKEKANGAL